MRLMKEQSASSSSAKADNRADAGQAGNTSLIHTDYIDGAESPICVPSYTVQVREGDIEDEVDVQLPGALTQLDTILENALCKHGVPTVESVSPPSNTLPPHNYVYTPEVLVWLVEQRHILEALHSAVASAGPVRRWRLGAEHINVDDQDLVALCSRALYLNKMIAGFKDGAGAMGRCDDLSKVAIGIVARDSDPTMEQLGPNEVESETFPRPVEFGTPSGIGSGGPGNDQDVEDIGKASAHPMVSVRGTEAEEDSRPPDEHVSPEFAADSPTRSVIEIEDSSECEVTDTTASQGSEEHRRDPVNCEVLADLYSPDADFDFCLDMDADTDLNVQRDEDAVTIGAAAAVELEPRRDNRASYVSGGGEEGEGGGVMALSSLSATGTQHIAEGGRSAESPSPTPTSSITGPSVEHRMGTPVDLGVRWGWEGGVDLTTKYPRRTDVVIQSTDSLQTSGFRRKRNLADALGVDRRGATARATKPTPNTTLTVTPWTEGEHDCHVACDCSCGIVPRPPPLPRPYATEAEEFTQSSEDSLGVVGAEVPLPVPSQYVPLENAVVSGSIVPSYGSKSISAQISLSPGWLQRDEDPCQALRALGIDDLKRICDGFGLKRASKDMMVQVLMNIWNKIHPRRGGHEAEARKFDQQGRGTGTGAEECPAASETGTRTRTIVGDQLEGVEEGGKDKNGRRAT
eukprot:gene5203-6635_t